MRNLPRNALLALTTALGQLRCDPARFVLLVARRFPGALARPASGMLRRGGSLGRAYAHWMLGERDAAVAELAALPQGTPSPAPNRTSTPPLRGTGSLQRHRPTLRDRVAAALAIAADRPDLAQAVTPTIAARAHWQVGELRAALSALRRGCVGGALKHVIESELRLLTPGMRLGASTRRIPYQPPTGAPRVLHLLTSSLPHTQSGYSLRSHEVLRALQRAGVAGWAVTRGGYPVSVGRLVAADDDEVDGVTYLRALPAVLPLTTAAQLEGQVRALDAVVARFRPTVIHTTTDYQNALVAQAVAARHRLPWTYEVRGMREKTWAGERANAQAREAALASDRYLMAGAREVELARAADAVFTISATMRDELIARGVPGARLHVVPNSIDAALFCRDAPPEQARAALGLPREGFWVGAVSSLVEYEGHAVLVDAVARLREAGVDARLLLVGDGAARPALLRRAGPLGAAAMLPGRVPAQEAADWVLALDAVVVPRLDLPVTRSVMPLKPIEAMALGRPVIVSDLPPLREVAGEGRGVLVAPGSVGELAAAITDAARGRAADAGLARVRTSREFAAGLTWDAAAATYKSVFEGLASRA